MEQLEDISAAISYRGYNFYADNEGFIMAYDEPIGFVNFAEFSLCVDSEALNAYVSYLNGDAD